MATISSIQLNGSQHDIRASKLGNATIGSSAKPIYLEDGVPIECDNIRAEASDIYDSTSHDAMSGIAVSSAGFIKISSNNNYEELES